jgi:hypothetical protein
MLVNILLDNRTIAQHDQHLSKYLVVSIIHTVIDIISFIHCNKPAHVVFTYA